MKPFFLLLRGDQEAKANIKLAECLVDFHEKNALATLAKRKLHEKW